MGNSHNSCYSEVANEGKDEFNKPRTPEKASKRRDSYNSIEDQLDALYKDMLAGKLDTTGTWATHIKSVKDSNPK